MQHIHLQIGCIVQDLVIIQSKFNYALIYYKNGQLNKAKNICIEILKI